MNVDTNTARAMALASVLAIGGTATVPREAGADETIIIVDGAYWYSETGEGDAVPIEDAFKVIRIGDGPPPGDDDDDDPPSDSELRKQVRAWAAAVNRPNDAYLLAGTYGLLAEKIGDGTVPSTTSAVNTAMNDMLGLLWDKSPVDEDDWKEFDDNVTNALARMVVTHPNASPPRSAWVKFFEDVEGGLNDSRAGEFLEGFWEQFLNLLLQWLIQLLTDLFDNAGEVSVVDPGELRYGVAPDDPRRFGYSLGLPVRRFVNGRS